MTPPEVAAFAMQRFPVLLRRRAIACAALQGVTLQQFTIEAITAAVEAAEDALGYEIVSDQDKARRPA